MIFYKKNEKISLVFGIVPITDFWPRFYIVVLGMTFFSLQFTFSNFYLDFYFPFFLGLLFSLFSLDFYFPFFWGLLFSLWTFISLFSLDFYFPFSGDFYFPFSHWTFISLFSLDFYFLFGRLFNCGHILDFFQIFTIF